MATWKKVVVSGSDAHLHHITASHNLVVSGTIEHIGTKANFGPVTSSGAIRATLPATSDTTYVVVDSDGDFGKRSLPTIPAAANDNTITITAGDGLKTSNDVTQFTTNAGSDVEVGLAVDVSDFAGTGLEDEGSENLAVSAAQTGITSITNTSLVIGRDNDNLIKFGTDNEIIFEVAGADKVSFTSGGHITASSMMVDTHITASSGTISASGFIGDLTGTASFVSSLEGATLADGKIPIGDSNNDVAAQTISGVIAITRGGVTTLAAQAVDEDALHTSVAGNGLTGGNGSALAVGAGTGIDVSSNAVAVDVSDFMTNGSNNRVVTATGTDAMNAEANLTFDGSTLTVTGGALITGDLTIQGDTIQQQVTNLLVEDRFILLNSGSASGDGGIIVSTESDGVTGAALGYDDSLSRWVIAPSGEVASGDTAFAANDNTQMLVAVSHSSGAPSGNPDSFGADAASRVGLMFVDTSNEDIYIFS